MGLKESQRATSGPFRQSAQGWVPARPIAHEQSLLRTVLDNMAQGVLLFDANAKLVFCNRRYIEMYGLSSDLAKPGCALLDLLNYRLRARTFSGNPAEYIAELTARIAEGKTFIDVVTSGDGRSFSIVNKPLAEGGWLATHEDVTERQCAE